MKRVFQIIFVLLIFSCSTKEHANENKQNFNSERNDINESSDDQEERGENNLNEDNNDSNSNYSDGIYCAEVSYYNHNTGTNSSYTLTVEIENNEVIKINWPNRGWLDNDHFNGADLDDNGNTNFTSDKGYDYEVQIIGQSSNCFANVPNVHQCNGVTEDGDQCQNMTDNVNGLCWQHQDQE